MAFSENVKLEAFKKAKGRCEECGKQLVWDNHLEGERGAWEAHHITAISAKTGTDTLSNCRVLCLDCHKKTETYGVGHH